LNSAARYSLGIFLVVFLTHVISPNATPFDSRWSIFTAHSLIHEGNADLNEFRAELVRQEFYAIECVGAGYRRAYPVNETSPCERYYNFYPIAVPVLAAPFVGALEIGTRFLQPWLQPVADSTASSVARAFLTGDMVNASMLVEVVIASFVIALSAVVMYLIGREMLTPRRALLVPLLFSFCTAAWSTGSRALWQHGFSMLLIALAVWVALVARRRPHVIAFAGVPLMLAMFVRPTNVVPLTCFAAFVWLRYRSQFVRFIAWSAPVAVVFLTASFVTYGTILAPYAFARRTNSYGLSIHPEFLEALVGNLISPGRGLLIFTPLFLLCVPGIWGRSAKVYETNPLEWLGIAIIGFHWLLISLYEDWWGGHCFGSRYFSDLTPLFIFLLFPAIALLFRPGHRAVTSAFLVLAAISFFIHFRGATSWATMEWNSIPSNIRSDPGRIWQWRDLQFLRGLPEPIASRSPE
jgi:hypothetical protein